MQILKYGDGDTSRLAMKKRYSYSKKINLPPGSLVYTGLQTETNPEIASIRYSNSQYEKKIIENEDEIDEFSKRDNNKQINWLNLKGVSSTRLIEHIGNSFNFHPLLMEDLLNPNQRPKVEEYEDMIFIVLRRIIWDIDNSDLSSEQLSFILSGSKLISFQEKNDNLFNPIEQRLEKSKGRIRGSDSFYLLYSIMDMIIDRYFLVLEQIEEKIDEIEFNLQKNFDSIDVKDIHDLKHAMTVFKKYVWPLRELINNLSRTEHPLINSSNSLYFRDLTDHVYQVLDIVENHREMVSHLLDLYMTMIGNKTNDIMKVLTIIATIFIPLSFIAGVYGMNFQFMPELSSPWGYPIFWVVIIVISGILLYYFRRKKWI